MCSSAIATGAHLHASFAKEGDRRFLTNSVLWTAKVHLDAAKLGEYLKAKK